ncbi:hypothetical protein [Leptolyngbya sp. FACHB-1515]|uniref:hypothetical protein n=1 Tax=Leptolyngbya sp. FACHB-1515 TaxID=2933931 RepID=UPI0032990095
MAVPGMGQKSRPSIEIYCTSEAQKDELKAIARERGLSVSRFLLNLAFANGRDVGARRRAEGALLNFDVYWQLGLMAQRLLDRSEFTDQEKAELHELIQQTRREIALKRLYDRTEESR